MGMHGMEIFGLDRVDLLSNIHDWINDEISVLVLILNPLKVQEK